MAFKIVVLGGKEIEADEDGFIQQPELWDEAVALDLAKQDGIGEMTDDHWEVVNYIRNYWLKFDIAKRRIKILIRFMISSRVGQLMGRVRSRGCQLRRGALKLAYCIIITKGAVSI